MRWAVKSCGVHFQILTNHCFFMINQRVDLALIDDELLPIQNIYINQ
jgi:hypothetical protein